MRSEEQGREVHDPSPITQEFSLVSPWFSRALADNSFKRGKNNRRKNCGIGLDSLSANGDRRGSKGQPMECRPVGVGCRSEALGRDCRLCGYVIRHDVYQNAFLVDSGRESAKTSIKSYVILMISCLHLLIKGTYFPTSWHWVL